MTFKISRALVRETPKMLSATKIPSAPNAKRLEVEQALDFWKESKELGAASFNGTASYKF